MARQLKADGAIITRTVPSGANFVDVMLTVQACEKKGVKTVLLTPEWGGKDGTELPLVFYVPEATAMVSTSSTDREYKLPAPAKIIGVGEGGLVRLYSGDSPFSPWGELTVDGHGVTGACDWWGEGYHTRIGY
jgi:glycine reductase